MYVNQPPTEGVVERSTKIDQFAVLGPPLDPPAPRSVFYTCPPILSSDPTQCARMRRGGVLRQASASFAKSHSSQTTITLSPSTAARTGATGMVRREVPESAVHGLGRLGGMAEQGCGKALHNGANPGCNTRHFCDSGRDDHTFHRACMQADLHIDCWGCECPGESRSSRRSCEPSLQKHFLQRMTEAMLKGLVAYGVLRRFGCFDRVALCLRITAGTFQRNPEPHRAWMSLKSIVPHLVQNVSEFA